MDESKVRALLGKAASGDRTEAGELVRRYEGTGKAAIHRRLGPEIRGRVDTEDIFQFLTPVMSRGQRIQFLLLLASWTGHHCGLRKRGRRGHPPRVYRDSQVKCTWLSIASS